MKIEDYAITVNGDCYAIDLNKLKNFCLISDQEKNKEQEIMENWEYEPASENDDPRMIITSKVNRELKTSGNPQNDSIIYDMMKQFLSVLLTADESCNLKFQDMTLSWSIAFNTFLNEGIIYKIENE